MTEERITGVIPDLRTGMFGNKSFSLVVTDRRLIFAQITNELLKQEREKAVSDSGGGLMSKWKASMGSHYSFHERYYDMDPEAVLRENQNNFEIRPEQVKSVKLRSSNAWSNDGKQSPNKMVIKWSGGKNKYNFQRVNTDEVKKVLYPLLGSRVR